MNKVIITAPSLDPSQNVSGISSVAKFIIDNNHEVKYIHFEIGKKDKEKGGLYRGIRILKTYIKWRKCLKENPNAIIHYSYPLSGFSIIRDFPLLAYCIRKKKDLVIHIHGGLYLTAPKIPFLFKLILKKVFSWHIPFIVLSKSEADILKKRFGVKKIYTLPNCVDLNDATEHETDRNNIDNNKSLTIGYLGRIEQNKGMTEILSACKILQDKEIPFKLCIAGKEQSQGEFIPHFEKQLGQNFHYAGIVAGKAKKEFLENLDVFILPSYFEGLPMSLLECMSYGITSIVTPVGSIPEIIKDGENGIFIEVKNSDAIVKAFQELNRNRPLLKKLGKNARKTIFQNFSPDSYIEKLNEIYKEAALNN